MAFDKLEVTESREVQGQEGFKQKYNFIYLPKENTLDPKISLEIKTDTYNSLRFAHEHELFDLVIDSFLSYMFFIEKKKEATI